MFLSALHCVGSCESVLVADAWGPRNCGQASPPAAAVKLPASRPRAIRAGVRMAVFLYSRVLERRHELNPRQPTIVPSGCKQNPRLGFLPEITFPWQVLLAPWLQWCLRQ